jgi:hypothetical protein
MTVQHMPSETRPTGDKFDGPTVCPYGHPLGAGNVLVGWRPCTDCPDARGNRNGHTTYQCLACGEHPDLGQRRKTIAYFPPHVPDSGERGKHPHG